MAAVREFEEYECWKRARELTNAVYKVTRDNKSMRDYAFTDQIRRASISVMNNIAEGHERGSNRDFVKFMYIARGSAGEVRNMLYIGFDQGYLDQSAFDKLEDISRQTAKACYGLIKYLSKNFDWKSKLSLALYLFFSPLAFRVTTSS
jgi:four helix bundle protein